MHSGSVTDQSPQLLDWMNKWRSHSLQTSTRQLQSEYPQKHLSVPSTTTFCQGIYGNISVSLHPDSYIQVSATSRTSQCLSTQTINTCGVKPRISCSKAQGKDCRTASATLAPHANTSSSRPNSTAQQMKNKMKISR